VVGGDPVPKKRIGRTLRGRSYNPNQRQQAEFANVVREQFESACGHVPQFSELANLHMVVEFHFRVSGREPHEHDRSLKSKGDVDNFAKFVQDALQDVLYVNDKQIIRLEASKHGWTDINEGHTVVELKILSHPPVGQLGANY
jgi:Holliday junction resolvase RusA-like endonuclease